MSVEAFNRCLRAPVGGNPKVVLLGLANHAHPDGSHAFPAIDTLAEYAHCDRRTAQRNVRKLEALEFVAADGFGPNGQVNYRIQFDAWEGGRQSDTPAASEVEGGGTGAARTVKEPATPTAPPTRSSKDSTAASRARADEVPEDFPDELRPHAREVMRVLKDLAEQTPGARAVKARAVASTIMPRQRKPLVKAAHDYRAWAIGNGRRGRDVVAGWRNWLDKEPDLATWEPLHIGEDGGGTMVVASDAGRKPWSGAVARHLRSA